jgi:hypothetical protein
MSEDQRQITAEQLAQEIVTWIKRSIERNRPFGETAIEQLTVRFEYWCTKQSRVADAMRAAIDAPDFDTAKNLLRTVVEKEAPEPSPIPRFGGEPGTPVPEVDPEDLKGVWDFLAKLRAKSGERAPQIACEPGLFERLCKLKPSADVQAVCYRVQMMSLVAMLIQTQQLAPNEAGTLDMKVFTAMAKIPLEWMGEGVREELPFDVERFLQQCA